jgi:murein DD-endopeptidase MepM/ murein hydrolase activator NlpD
VRTILIASCGLAALGACAGNPARPSGPPAIEYRGARPASAPAPVAAAPTRPAPSPNRPAPGERPTASPAVAEAAALQPNTGARPGGSLRQAPDNPDARAIRVQSGDTLYDISRRYSVNMRALIETNGMEPPYALKPGQTVLLPPPNVHIVERGETLYSVSRRYNVDTRSLALMNGLQRPWTVWPGDEILLPPLARDVATPPASPTLLAGAAPIATPPVAPAPRPAASTPAVTRIEGPIALTPGSPALKTPPPAVAQPPVTQSVQPASNPSGPASFLWPVDGPILAGYGVSANGTRNDGVNIGAADGAEVRASAAGEVVYAGDELAGFGNLVLIRHDGGWVSAYAHAERLLVREGQTVAQGEPIARAGVTAKGEPQVHFELRRGREPVNPADHLPALRG